MGRRDLFWHVCVSYQRSTYVFFVREGVPTPLDLVLYEVGALKAVYLYRGRQSLYRKQPGDHVAADEQLAQRETDVLLSRFIAYGRRSILTWKNGQD